MGLLQKLLAALVGFVFTIGGFGKVSARETAPTTAGTAVIARENRSPAIGANSAESLRNRLILLAATKDKNSKNKTKKTKKKSKSRSRSKSTKTKPKSPRK